MTETSRDKKKILSKNLFPVVGIGASAGGLEAFKKLVKAIPTHSGMAYILVQHLHPDHSSALPQILQRETKIPVHEISNNVKVQPDNVYIIPSNKMLVANDGILKLSPRPSKDHRNMPIDIFFSSLAEVHQSHAIGIVLSGNGADGTIGLQNIKGHGGITFAEDPVSASYDSMPQSAINADVVDFILTPEKMPQQLLQVNRTYNILPDHKDLTPEELSEDESFSKVLALLRSRYGVDFTYYKQTTIHRRMLRRMVILKLEKIVDYLECLKKNDAELDTLFNEMLIPVTSLFRDPKTFENLCKTILPEVVKNKSKDKLLRLWVAGCSTGQEAYSIAICLHECLGDKLSSFTIQIFATDISEKVIIKARTGLYHKNETEGISEKRLQQFFIKTNDHYQVKKTIRDMCVFACHNLLKDPPFAKIDLISCRNVLIYFEPFLQKKALSVFHYALNEKGFLWLGNSETIGSSADLFLSIETKEKFYLRKTIPGRSKNFAYQTNPKKLVKGNENIGNIERKKDDFQKNADDILLLNYTPASVIINDQFDIVQFRGSTGDFLEPSPGKASLNIMKMAREGLSFELRSAVHKAKKSKEPFIKQGIIIDNGKRSVTIEVIPLLNTIDLHFLILFKESLINPLLTTDKLPAKNNQDQKNSRIHNLEKDLSQSREDMRSIAEEQETANEELQSANEELLSGSEELQSLNEELETSKEELQSTNEELITVNQELFERNEQLNTAKLYAEAIVSIMHEPLLVLSTDFKILSANKSFYKDFAIKEEETIGKTLFELQNNQWNIPEVRNKLLKIQSGKEKFLEWEITYTFPSVGKRFINLNAQPIQQENGEHWILLAFNDITFREELKNVARKKSEDQIKILENIPQITITTSPEGKPTYFNRWFTEYSGMILQEATSQQWSDFIKPEFMPEAIRQWRHSMLTGENFSMEMQLKRKSDSMYRWHLGRASAIRNDHGNIISWVAAAVDIHDHKTKEQAKDEFISIASHELKTPLTTVKAYVQLLQMSLQSSNNKDLMFADKANESINKLIYLLGELLDVSKIQNGKLSLNICTYNFNEMLTSAIEGVQYAMPSHDIIKTGKTIRQVKGDKERMEQVVINLLTNAVKYSPDAKEVLINVLEENGAVKVSVKDSGIGIQKENLGKIFDRYYREEEHAYHFPGLGIGLSICKDIIERHNGKIWVESDPDKGSTFYFKVPVQSIVA
jgi:two-component system CheB/CheR fusion protein